MARLIIMKKGGEPGEVAINPEQITYIRSSSGPFTDIYFGDQRVAVDGSFHQVMQRLAGYQDEAPAGKAPRNWLSSG